MELCCLQHRAVSRAKLTPAAPSQCFAVTEQCWAGKTKPSSLCCCKLPASPSQAVFAHLRLPACSCAEEPVTDGVWCFSSRGQITTFLSIFPVPQAVLLAGVLDVRITTP